MNYVWLVLALDHEDTRIVSLHQSKRGAEKCLAKLKRKIAAHENRPVGGELAGYYPTMVKRGVSE